MSFMFTAQQMRDRTKTVTRRLGWRDLKPGTRLLAVERCQGIKPGQVVEVFGEIEVVDVRREHLRDIHVGEPEREGFPGMCCGEFVQMFCKHMKCDPNDLITRIEFKHVEGTR
jgi:hypothetical protein